MKKDIHPTNYRPVVFLDTSCGAKFLVHSTVDSKETTEWQDEKNNTITYPLVRIGISSTSHPMYTGKRQVENKEGPVARFNKKYNFA